MKTLQNKRILLGVTGGIAAYKSAELVRRLREQGAEVQVVMTRGAFEFITPLTMQALSGRPVHTELLDHDSEAGMGHIELARWSDVILIAPGSANFIAKLTYGMADDLLSTLCLAADVPLLVAPAMNQQMWRNRATQANIETIMQREISILGPAEGDQACGEVGPGRMLEAVQLLHAVEAIFQNSMLAGKHVIVTAGPTREAIDPVRYISNRSSGRMGYAMARAALEAGANVTLVSGPVSLQAPDQVNCVKVNTAKEMRDVVLSNADDADIFIAAAAVADYRCEEIAEQKIKKSEKTLSIKLEKNPDVLADVANLLSSPFTVGFAAETESLKDNAIKKLKGKGLDMIAANLVGDELGFDKEDNALEVFWSGGSLSLQTAPKEKLARQLVHAIALNYYEKHSNKAH
ncbi:MAG: bifunctional phosphopantothenoylcysteine decarboxylase/phosphopantothenate--cysteine ligase CoaBC [Gammaproteobacteria bacterium]|jgi:phosphopantothenoylcysteine decarboxylase / phosphopantothenate---cysteine ligase|nr:bifunctional phosphopantothenoylcysteine decarboxylase/phosphopantothenate--cysteine ligase CoaBC [Gammaproteobacteria bacterium]